MKTNLQLQSDVRAEFAWDPQVQGQDIHVIATDSCVSPDGVTRKIKEALERRADRTSKHINVDTMDGIVTLTGSVPSFGDRRAAEGAAWSAPGIRGVRDELVVAP